MHFQSAFASIDWRVSPFDGFGRPLNEFAQAHASSEVEVLQLQSARSRRSSQGSLTSPAPQSPSSPRMKYAAPSSRERTTLPSTSISTRDLEVVEGSEGLAILTATQDYRKERACIDRSNQSRQYKSLNTLQGPCLPRKRRQAISPHDLARDQEQSRASHVSRHERSCLRTEVGCHGQRHELSMARQRREHETS